VIDPCDECKSERVAAVVDKRIEAAPTPGNKYRTRCLNCERWLPMCSAADFQTADIQHVLPRDADPEADDPTVPADEYDGVVSSPSTTPEAMTDGGQDLADDEGDDGDDENHDVHRFECPKCGRPVEGYPNSCPHPDCGVSYNWPDEAGED
jgi:hypothetical protein